MDTTGRIRDKVRRKTKDKPYLPDDIIPNILCRLPAKNAGQCRLVCKGWRDLTLTQDFVDLHFRHSFPMILVANYSFNSGYHLLLDKWWEPARRKLLIHTFETINVFSSYYGPEFSHAGLVVCRTYDNVIILNPINLEKVTISLSLKLSRSEIYGVFFHSSLGEYCSLWRIEVSHATQGQPSSILYKMLSLGSKPFLKTVCNPFTHRVKKYSSHPLSIDKYLYWMLESEQKQGYKYSGRKDIMQFDIIGEEFSVKPCPVPVDTKCDSNQTHLLNINGALSFLVIFPSKITIWRLEDHADQLWTTSNYTFSLENFEDRPKPIAVVGGSLALMSDRILLVYDLMQGTIKCFRKKKYHRNVLFLSHQVSLASLSNCPSTLYLDGKGEVDVKENRSNTDSSDRSARSSNSTSLVNEGSDIQSDDSGPSYPVGKKSMSFEIASTDDEEEGDWKKKVINIAEGCARKGLEATKQELHNGFKAILELLKQGTCIGPKEVETGEQSSREEKIEKFADKGKGKAKDCYGQGEEKGGPDEVETRELSSCEEKNEKFVDKGKGKAKEVCEK